MILTTITCCLLHLRKNRNRKKEIAEWISVMKHCTTVYHPLLHWIKNNNDLSIKIGSCSSDNEECNKINIWMTQNALAPRYKKTPRTTVAFDHKANAFSSPPNRNRSILKSAVNVASGAVRYVHSTPKGKVKHISFANSTKSLKKIFTSPTSAKSFAKILSCKMEHGEKQPCIVLSKKSEPLGSPEKQKH